MEVLAYRIVWALPFLAVLATLGKQWSALRSFGLREYGMFAVCAVLIGANWLVFIYGVQQEKIAETALGYFINPLISIALGGLLLREPLSKLGLLSVGVAAMGLLLELVQLGELPWIALTLAGTFGLYGLMRKQMNVPAAAGLGVETTMLLPLALLYLASGGDFLAGDQLPERSAYQLFALACGGVVTVVPLIPFVAAATRLPLVTLGFIQYLAPSISLMLAVWGFGETVDPWRWVSFGFVWLGIVLYSVDSVVRARRANVSAAV